MRHDKHEMIEGRRSSSAFIFSGLPLRTPNCPNEKWPAPKGAGHPLFWFFAKFYPSNNSGSHSAISGTNVVRARVGSHAKMMKIRVGSNILETGVLVILAPR